MSFYFNRALSSGETQVKKFLDLSSQGGYDIIELIWSKVRKANAKVSGFEIPIEGNRNSIETTRSDEVDLTINIKTVIGLVYFYVDGEDKCWAYIIDSDYNRNKLAETLKTGWFKIVDAKKRKEIEDLAKAKHLPIEVQIKKRHGIKMSKQETDLINELRKKDSLEQQLVNEINDLKSKLNAIQPNSIVQPKPLAGVRIDRDKVKPIE